MNDLQHHRDGAVVLYRRAGSEKWQARLRQPGGGWTRMGTGEEDPAAAARIACLKYDDMAALARHGIETVKRPTFGRVAELVIADLEAKMASGERGNAMAKSYLQTLRRWLIPFFGHHPINRIDDETLAEFDRWRLAEAGRPLRATTINTHNITLRKVFKKALQKKWISDAPEINKKGVAGERGTWFEPDEVEKLLDHLDKNTGSGRKAITKSLNYLLMHYVAIILGTGMRPGTEMRNLRWKHVEIFEKAEREIHIIDGKPVEKTTLVPYLRIHVEGKTGKRSLIARKYTWIYFDMLCPPGDRDPEGFVFRLPDGSEPKDLHGAFERVLTATGLLDDRHGRRRTLYSLRHTYATTSLAAKVNHHFLARQMGTSIKMIETHYSHWVPSMQAAELSQDPRDLGADLDAVARRP